MDEINETLAERLQAFGMDKPEPLQAMLAAAAHAVRFYARTLSLPRLERLTRGDAELIYMEALVRVGVNPYALASEMYREHSRREYEHRMAMWKADNELRERHGLSLTNKPATPGVLEPEFVRAQEREDAEQYDKLRERLGLAPVPAGSA